MRKKLLLAALLVPVAAAALAAADPGRQTSAPAPIVAVAYARVPHAPPPVVSVADNLPTVAVPPLVVHAAPSDANSTPARPYTVVPLQHELAVGTLPREEPPPRSSQAALEAGQPLAGLARAADGTALEIEGRRVPLFGVKLAPHDHGAAARAALARHLAAKPAVTCNAPPGQTGRPEYVCHDRAGVDLGAMLVRRGWAVADRSRSYQYLDDEAWARAHRAGLWAKR